MKKKVLIPIFVMLLLAVGAFCAFLINDAYRQDEIPTGETVDLAAQVVANRENAFAFMKKTDNILPEDAKGYVVDTLTDIDFSDTTETALKASAEDVFTKVDAIQPDTVVIKHYKNVNYSPSGFNVLSHLITKAKEQNLYTVLYLTDTSADKESVLTAVSLYGADAVMLSGDGVNETSSSEIRDYVSAKGFGFGLYFANRMSGNAKKITENNACDFCFVQIDYSTENGADTVISDWVGAGLSCNTKIYGVVRNDLVKSGDGWTKSNEVNNIVKLLYNTGGFSGCVMHSLAKLKTDDNDTTTNLYSYYEYFNNVDYTALTYTDIKIENDKITFSGTTDKDFPTYVYSTSGGWQSVAVTGDDGTFTVSVPLIYGENTVTVKHKNARYSYNIIRNVDVLKDCTAKIGNNVVTLTAKAVKGAVVFASLANTVPVELVSSGADDNGYDTFTATYELKDYLVNLKENQVSFGASYGGLTDFVMCGEQKEITPFDDHGLGTSTICRVEKNYTETTSSLSEDDTSDPLCTPQLTGAYGYVENVSVSDNHLLLHLSSGMKLHCDNTTLILGGYIMPEKTVTLESVDFSDGTKLTFSDTYSTFVKMSLAPQEYYTGYLERVYNVKSFDAEYMDIVFCNTDYCAVAGEFDYSQSDVVSSVEWYGNEDDDFMMLRLYLKTKGNFGGYSFEKTDDGKTVLTLRKKPDSLTGTVIMIDAGHGGYGSPGTMSDSGVYEEDVVFSIATKTAEILRNHGATVVVTRGEDECLFLGERVDMIRKNKPDIFLSIHADGADSKNWYGTHTFYYKNYSMPLADAIHKQLVSAYRTNYYTDKESKEYEKVDMGIKFFPYMVTRVEECPSVLVECGYLTNIKDAQFMTDSNGQGYLATAIAQGVVDYLAG